MLWLGPLKREQLYAPARYSFEGCCGNVVDAGAIASRRICCRILRGSRRSREEIGGWEQLDVLLASCFELSMVTEGGGMVRRWIFEATLMIALREVVGAETELACRERCEVPPY
jgi:hypothetical protein